MRTRMRYLPAALLLLALLTAGSAAARTTAHTVTTIRVMGQTSGAGAWDAWVKNFEKANPDVDVQLDLVLAANLGQTLLTQLQAGNGPDVFYVQGGSGQINSTLNLAGANRLANLSSSPWVK